jgi:biopolymer transport protein TolR
MAKRRRKRKAIKYQDIELNIMPFIDVFSLLNTFLLMSAVFLQIGIIEVQIPFLSNNVPPDKTETKRVLDVKVDMEKDMIKVISSYTKPPINQEEKRFKNSPIGYEALHKHMVELRTQSPETDKVQFFTEDDVIWEDMSFVLDSIKLRMPGDPIFQAEGLSDQQRLEGETYVFPKVVMASVML